MGVHPVANWVIAPVDERVKIGCERVASDGIPAIERRIQLLT
jgi:hypothetical protein